MKRDEAEKMVEQHELHTLENDDISGCSPAALRAEHNYQTTRTALIAALTATPGEKWRHIANEWADAATNGLQWLRNVKDGISKPEDGIDCMLRNIKRIQDIPRPAMPRLAAAPPVCHAASDGECIWPECPQEKDGRRNYQPSCPLLGNAAPPAPAVSVAEAVAAEREACAVAALLAKLPHGMTFNSTPEGDAAQRAWLLGKDCAVAAIRARVLDGPEK